MIGMLIDVTKCIGCEKCVEACSDSNKLEKHIPMSQHVGDGLSANRWTSIVKRPKNRYVKKQCRHCLNPACVSACLVGAMHQSPEGRVVYDKSKCMGCRYCMMACPYGIPRYQWHKAVPYVQKCDLCHARSQKGKCSDSAGKEHCPACAEACPTGAITFGTRSELLVEARKRIGAADMNYIDRVFGEFEVGGSSVLYVSDIPLGFLGRRENLGNDPLPELTWASLKKVPAEFFGMGAIMAGIHWIVGRRNKLRHQNQSGQDAALRESQINTDSPDGNGGEEA